ncbi:MAG: hypothetical protein Alpg2KO_31770 [Alphaproteobacteria bacterium]
MKTPIKQMIQTRKGASVLGYGMVVGLISVISLAAITNVGQSGKSLFGEVSDQMGTVTGDGSGSGSEAASGPTDSGPPVWSTNAALGSVNFGTSVNITLSASDADGAVTYSSADLPSWLALDGSTGALSGMAVAEGEVGATSFTVTASQGGDTVDRLFNLTTEHPTSCNSIATAQAQTPGYQLRTINPSGSETFQAQCYFDDGTWGGGGFTAIAVQYEGDPVAWTEGRQPDYDSNTQDGSNVSFALTGSDIPSHNTLMFGRAQSGNKAVVDILSLTYTTGNLGTTRLTSPVTSTQYDIHRNASLHFGHHNPEESSGSNVVWDNTLTIDAIGGRTYSWSFSPNRDLVHQQGYGLAGLRYNTSETYGWILLVR